MAEQLEYGIAGGNSQIIPSYDKSSMSFTQSLNGFADAQSSNTLRNSISPISFPKAKRFLDVKHAGASAPFYNTLKDYDIKKGTSFGYGKKIGHIQKSESPGPGKYENVSTNSLSPVRNGKPKFGKFGVGYDRFKLTCDINKGIKVFDDRNKPGPNSYMPDRRSACKKMPVYSMGRKLPGKIEALEKQSGLPSPFHYSVKTDTVLPSKYKKIGFGFGLKSNANSSKLSPGPGDYNLHSFTDRFRASIFSQTRKQQQNEHYHSVQPSPRACSLVKPLTGGAFNPMGELGKDKTVGFNYPPIKFAKNSQGANTMFYKTDGFNQKRGSNKIGSPENVRNSAMMPPKNNPMMPEMGSASEQSSETN